MRIVGLDQGTTSSRALLLTNDGSPRVMHAVRHREQLPQPGHHEQDGEELVANLRQCLAAVPGPVDAIGLANQGESCLAWEGDSGRPLTPVITWQDNRTSGYVEALRASGVEGEVRARSGLPLDPYFSASKLGWIIANSAPAKEALRAGNLRLGTTDAFFLDRLAGTFATDVTTASRTSLMNLRGSHWDERLCEIFSVPIECLPQIRPTIGDFGTIDGVPVLAAAVDQQAALWGHGCRSAGQMKITFGTGAFALAILARDADVAPSGLLPTIAWSHEGETTRALEGGVYDAGSALEWAQSLGIVRDLTELAVLEGEPAIASGVAFVPALSGLASPYWDRSAAACWIGMTKSTSRFDLIKALLEGIAFRVAEVVDAMGRQVQIADVISVDGGLSRSDYFCRFLADILGRILVRPQFDELTALGCAWMAQTALGIGPSPSVDGAAFFEPSGLDRGDWRRKFSEAVGRSRGWR